MHNAGRRRYKMHLLRAEMIDVLQLLLEPKMNYCSVRPLLAEHYIPGARLWIRG